MMKIRSKILATTAAAWLGIAAAPLTWAQAGDPEAERSASSYSDFELRSVALAVVEVKRINDVYVPRFGAAANSAERQQVRRMASVEMRQAVEKHISVDRYAEIVSQARLDAELADRIRQHMQDAQ
jgi:hypothetical protein